MTWIALLTWCCASAALAAQATPPPAADPVVAIVTAVNGSVTRQIPGRAPEPVTLFDRLRDGVEVWTAAESGVTVAWRSGARARLRPAHRARVTATTLLPLDGESGVERLPDVPTLPLVASALPLPGSALTAVRIRGREVGTLYPDAGARAIAEATTLQWTGDPAFTSYEVEVENARGDLVLRLRTRLTQVGIPDGVLAPANRYFWRVRARTADGTGTTGEAAFGTLTADEYDQRRRLHAALGASAEGRALAAELDEGLGLWREALLGFVAARDAGEHSAIVAARIAALTRRLDAAGTGGGRH